MLTCKLKVKSLPSPFLTLAEVGRRQDVAGDEGRVRGRRQRQDRRAQQQRTHVDQIIQAMKGEEEATSSD